MNRDYSVSFIGYIIYGVICIIGTEFFFAPISIKFLLEEIKTKAFFELAFIPIGGWLIAIFSAIAFLLSDSFFASILAPFTSYWRIGIREDGIYGAHFWEWGRITNRNLRKLCNWEDIVKIKRLGLFDMLVCRTRVILRNGKRFHFTNLGNTPAEILNFYTTKDLWERDIKYSSVMMYALIMLRIGEDKFEGFEKGRMWTKDEKNLFRAIKYVLQTEVDKIIEEDKKKAEELNQTKEEKESKQNG